MRSARAPASALIAASTRGAGTVSKSLTDRFKAGDLIRPIAQVLGGSGGGRPDMAQAGGTEVAKIDEALEKLYALVG